MKTQELVATSPRFNNFLKYLLSDAAFAVLTLPQRFLRKVEFRPDGCWQWTGAKHHHPRFTEYAYGLFAVDGRDPRSISGAHRYAYEATKGPIPDGLEVDHVCANKLCVNPEHLQAVTHKQNCATRRKRQRVPGSVRWLQEQRRAQ